METDYNKARRAATDFDLAASELDSQWHNSPMFCTNQTAHHTYGAYPYDPWANRPNYPSYRSHSLERLSQPFYVVRSPAASPVHTPCGSPARPRRPPPPPSKAPSGKPPLPGRQRPFLTKSKTVDCADDARPLDASSKIPSLDSLYEQLKVLSGSSTPPALPGPHPVIDNQLAADLTAVALEMVANSPLARRRSSTFSGSSAPHAQYYRPKVVFITRTLCKSRVYLRVPICAALEFVVVESPFGLGGGGKPCKWFFFFLYVGEKKTSWRFISFTT